MNLAETAPGLVVMLDAAGRTIEQLETRVQHLETELAAGRAREATLTELLAEARATATVPPPPQHGAENDDHATAPVASAPAG